MTDNLKNPKYSSWRSAAKAIWAEGGPKVSPSLSRSLSLPVETAKLTPLDVYRLTTEVSYLVFFELSLPTHLLSSFGKLQCDF